MKKKVMPKNKKAPQPQPITKTTWSLIAIFFLIVLYLILYIAQGNHLLDRPVARKTREDFAQIEQLVQDIQKEADKNGLSGFKSYRSCNQFNYKFREGEKYCSVGIEQTRKLTSEVEARVIIDQFEGILSRQTQISRTEPYRVAGANKDFPTGLRAGFSGTGFSENETKTGCGSLYKIKENSKDDHTDLQVKFVCQDYAQDKFYPTLPSN